MKKRTTPRIIWAHCLDLYKSTSISAIDTNVNTVTKAMSWYYYESNFANSLQKSLRFLDVHRPQLWDHISKLKGTF